MEFLFTNQLASWEALLLLVSLGIIVVIYAYDAYLFIARVIGLITPRQEYLKEKTTSITPDEQKPLDIENPILSEGGDTTHPLPEKESDTREASNEDVSPTKHEVEDKNEVVQSTSESDQEITEEGRGQEEASENTNPPPSVEEIQNTDAAVSSIPEIPVEESYAPELSADEIRDIQEVPTENQMPVSITGENNPAEEHTEIIESLEMNDTPPDDPIEESILETEAPEEVAAASENTSPREEDIGTVNIQNETITNEEYVPGTIKESTPELVPETEDITSSTINKTIEE